MNQPTSSSHQSAPPARDPTILIDIFNGLFSQQYRTRLQGGAAEPLYQPADGPDDWHRVIFTRDYFASALHEIAHWCIAGPERRRQLDYGYWYTPDGRSQAQQAAFEVVEVKPQALEWIFSRSAGARFRLSADNLAGGGGPSQEFRRKVWCEAQRYCQAGLPARAASFTRALARTWGIPGYLEPDSYRLEDI